jgi:hypothetical protein
VRASDVLGGRPLPSRYCHINQRSSAITMIAQGIVGLVSRLVMSSAVQLRYAQGGVLAAVDGGLSIA